MQDRIGGPYEPIKFDGKEPKASDGKTNPVLFEQIKEYVSSQARAHLLLQALGFLELINQEELQKRSLATQENLSKEFMEKALPSDLMAKAAAQKVKNAGALIPLLQEFQKMIQQGNVKGAFAQLQEIFPHLNDPKKQSLPGKVQKELQQALKPLLNTKSPQTGKALNTLIFQTQVGQTVVAAQGNWGQSEPMILQSLMDKLKQMVNATPPGPFAELAKELMSKLQGANGDEILQALMQNPAQQQQRAEEEALGLLESKTEDPEVQNAVKSAVEKIGQNIGPKGLYETYLEEIQSHSTLSALKEGVETVTLGQKQYLLKALQVMKEGAPKDAKITKTLSNLVALKFPPVTDTEVQAIQKFLGDFYETYNALVQTKTLSRYHQREFLEKTKEYCDESIKTIENESDKQIDKIASLRKQLETVETLQPPLKTVSDALFSLEEGEKLTKAEVQNFSSALLLLQSKYGALTPRQKQEIETLMDELIKLAPQGKKSLANVMAACHLNALVTELAGSSPEALAKSIEEEVQNLKQKEGSDPLWSDFLTALDEQRKTPVFPSIPEASLNATSPKKASYHLAVVADTVDDTSAELKKQIAGVHQGAKILEAHKSSFYAARADAENKKLMTPPTLQDDPPLPWQFANVIFDKVIPNQNQMLLDAGALLSMFNGFSSGCNTVLSDLTGWDSADYDLSGWISSKDSGQKNGNGWEIYNVTPTQAMSQTQAALNQSASDYGKLYKAANDIQNQINQIPTPPANSYQAKRLTELQGDLSNLIDGSSVASLPLPSSVGTGFPIPMNSPMLPTPAPTGNCALLNLNAAYTNYGKMINDLHPQLGQGATTCALNPGYMRFLSINESSVMNGCQSGQGLNEIYTAISSEQTTYSGLSQQQQMQLQLTMTETQQMFSTITSAMQDLNQSYSSIAQAISK